MRSVSWQAVRPQVTATISVAMPFSFRRTASSTAISSNGFIDIFTFAVSTPEPSGFTRTLTLKSMTRLIRDQDFHGDGLRGSSGETVIISSPAGALRWQLRTFPASCRGTRPT